MKRLKRLCVLALAALLLLSLTGCGGESAAVILEGFALGHYDASESDALDSRYFYRNDLNVIGGDADIEWVPEERDPVFGGWYYLYTSGNVANGMNTYWKEGTTQSATTREEAAERVDHKASLTCLRSRDMNDWELCGAVDNGFSAYFESDSWVKSHAWAPEVIYDAYAAKYYMYFNTLSYENDGGFSEDMQYGNSRNNFYDTFYICVMESDTPVGPFRIVESEDYYADLTEETMNDAQRETYARTGLKSNLNGKVLTHRNPTINVTYDLGIRDAYFSVIDISPFFDDDGTLYLSFVRHISTGHGHNCLWMMRMKDMVTPDYDTLTMVGTINYEYVTAENLTGKTGAARADESAYTLHNCFAIPRNATYAADLRETLEAAMKSDRTATVTNPETGETEHWTKGQNGTWEKDGWADEGAINEGPHMWKANGRYFYMYSPRGFSDQNYDATQTYSDTRILGPYHKLPQMPGAIMSRGFGMYINDYMSGTGHHAFVEVDGELFCIYYAHADPYNGSTSATDGRFYAFDRVRVIEDATYGTLLAGVGPTQTVQYKPTSYTGLKNVAPLASVSATNCDESTLPYLTDDFFVCHEYFADREFTAQGQTTITLRFGAPVTISALMIYNTLDYDHAFSGIDAVQFRLADAPAWVDAAYRNQRACYIRGIGFNPDYIDAAMRKIRMGASAAVSFDEITVTEIAITVSAKISDLDSVIRISDIVVLGREAD